LKLHPNALQEFGTSGIHRVHRQFITFDFRSVWCGTPFGEVYALTKKLKWGEKVAVLGELIRELPVVDMPNASPNCSIVMEASFCINSIICSFVFGELFSATFTNSTLAPRLFNWVAVRQAFH
jgi:hypothetical protein